MAYGIISLLAVEPILQVGSSAGFAMVFALLIAAIIWNLGTWYLGLPASSSHTLIGSIIGVGIANALVHGQDGTDVAEAIKLMSEHDVSALPVVEAAGKLVGVLSEADLIHRVEIGTEKHRPWWLEAVTGASTLPKSSPSLTARRSPRS